MYRLRGGRLLASDATLVTLPLISSKAMNARQAVLANGVRLASGASRTRAASLARWMDTATSSSGVPGVAWACGRLGTVASLLGSLHVPGGRAEPRRIRAARSGGRAYLRPVHSRLGRSTRAEPRRSWCGFWPCHWSRKILSGGLAAATGTTGGFTVAFAADMPRTVTSQEGIGLFMAIAGWSLGLALLVAIRDLILTTGHRRSAQSLGAEVFYPSSRAGAPSPN